MQYGFTWLPMALPDSKALPDSSQVKPAVPYPHFENFRMSQSISESIYANGSCYVSNIACQISYEPLVLRGPCSLPLSHFPPLLLLLSIFLPLAPFHLLPCSFCTFLCSVLNFNFFPLYPCSFIEFSPAPCSFCHFWYFLLQVIICLLPVLLPILWLRPCSFVVWIGLVHVFPALWLPLTGVQLCICGIEVPNPSGQKGLKRL